MLRWPAAPPRGRGIDGSELWVLCAFSFALALPALARRCKRLSGSTSWRGWTNLLMFTEVRRGARRSSPPWFGRGISLAGHCGDTPVKLDCFAGERANWSSANPRSARYLGCEPAGGEDALGPPRQRASPTTREPPVVLIWAHQGWLRSSVLQAGSMSRW